MTTNEFCPLQIGLLGPFYLTVNNVEIKEDVWKSKKALTMLKYLAAQQGQKVSTDVLIELLWPYNEGMDSLSNLHTAVWFVRRILTSKKVIDPHSRLRYSNGLYWLELEDGCIDLKQFEGHVKKSRQLATGDPTMALLHAESALALYRDDFLSEDVYEEWTISHRDDYQELYFEVVVRSAELMIKHRGDLQGAIQTLRKGVKKDPFREELYQMGIKAYILGERHVDAINLYNKYSKMLMDEFQLEPSQATQELIAQLKNKKSGKNTKPSNGAQVCDKERLQFILDSEHRRLKRKGNNFSIIVVVNPEGNARNQEVQTAFHVLQRSIRSSDFICQISDNLIVVFLPDTNAPESKIAWSRLREVLRKTLGESSALSYNLLHSEHQEQLKEEMESILAV